MVTVFLFSIRKDCIKLQTYSLWFFLSLSSVILFIIMFTWFIPKWLNNKKGNGHIFRTVMTIVIIVIAGKYFVFSSNAYRTKTFSFGSNPDTILLDYQVF
jgi:hypothetical protein